MLAVLVTALRGELAMLAAAVLTIAAALEHARGPARQIRSR